MCEYCKLQYNEKIGINCGRVMLKYCGLVITKNTNGKYVLSDNECDKDFEITTCPVCGEKLV